MATTISSGTNPYKLGSPPDFGTLYSGRALEFDGVTDSVDISASALLTGTSYTIACWVKLDDLMSSDGIIFANDNTTSNEIIDSLGIRAGKVGFNFEASDTGTQGLSTSTLELSTWYRIVLSVSGGAGSGTKKLYINGAEDTIVTASGNFYRSGTSTSIGARNTDGTADVFFEGKLSDFQAWDKAWSLSDTQYDYTHPEKLITHNSAVTSGTTISNLKAWYPCTEGNPRSPQTTVYDGSPKELGDNPSGYSSLNFDSADWGDVNIDSCTSNTFTTSAGGGKWADSSNTVQVIGTTYKCTLDATTTATSGFHIRNAGDASVYLIHASTSNYSGSFYFTATRVDLYITNQSAGTMTVNSISVQEVQMGNHGTTTFLGDELITSTNDRTFAGASNWANVDFNAYNESGDLTVTASAGDQYCTLPVANAPMTAGRKYRLTYDLANGGTGFKFQDFGSNQDFIGYTTLDNGTGKYIEFTAAAGVTGGFRLIAFNSSSTGDFDNFSLKEVGVAGGWTTADAEPLIPQTALMGMSKPMVFDGIDDYVKVDNAIGDLGSTFSFSAWIYRASITTSGAYLLDARGDAIGGTGYAYFGAGLATFGASSGTEYVDGSASNSVSADNKWHHVAITGMTVNIAEDIRFGARFNSTQFFDGIFNSISIWNKTLSLSEIQTIFNNGIEYDVRDTDLGYNTTYGSSNLKGYWRNDGASTWTDLSGNTSSDGDVNGSPDTILLPEGTTSGKDILGFPLTHTNNGWLNLDGVDNIVIVKDNDTLDFGTGSFTVEFWSKSDESTVNNRYIVQKYSNGWAIYGDNNTSLKIRLKDAGSEIQPYVSSSGVQDSTWHHWVMILDRSDHLCKVYKDSVRQTVTASDISTVPNVDNGNNLLIGGKNGTNLNWHGSLDEVRIYNRALTAYESDGTEPEVGETAVSGEVLKNYKHGKSKHS